MVWPLLSPGLNIMESVWDHVKRQKTLGQTQSTEELKQFLQDAGTTYLARTLKICAKVYLREQVMFQRQRVCTLNTE